MMVYGLQMVQPPQQQKKMHGYFPDMPSVQEQLKKVRRFTQYPDAMVIYEDKPK